MHAHVQTSEDFNASTLNGFFDASEKTENLLIEEGIDLGHYDGKIVFLKLLKTLGATHKVLTNLDSTGVSFWL